jgi:predicted RNA-binding protein with EMAP domain
MIRTPQLSDLVRTRGHKHDAKELAALKAIARKAQALQYSYRSSAEIFWKVLDLIGAVQRFERLTGSKS